jgi:hypothetical protein
MAIDGSWRWISWLLMGVGGSILMGGLALGFGSLRLVLHGERAAGEVIENRRDGDMYSPVVRFTLPNGELQQVIDLGSGAPDFAVGDRVTVLYRPDNPQIFRIGTFDRLWQSALIVSIFGVAWLAFAFAAWALSNAVDVAVIGESLFGAIAAVAVTIGAFVTWSAIDLYRSGLRTAGWITEIRSSRYTDQEETTMPSGRVVSRNVERTSYAPIVHFKTQEGREVEFFGRGGSGTSYAPGDRVTVIYDAANPIRARILSFIDLWTPAAVCWAVVVLFGGPVLISRHIRLRT